MLFCFLVCVLVVVLDQVTKLLVINSIAPGQVIEVIEGIFNLTYIENTGAAFGMLSQHRWVFMIISVVAIIAIGVYLWKEKPKSFWIKAPLAFILGGGIGNMIDRTFRPGVIDFIDADFVQYPQVSFEGGFDITLTDFPIFNVADCFITVGCAMLVVYLLFVELPREAKRKKASAESSEGEAPEGDTDEQ